MKKLLYTLLLLIAYTYAQAATYYVSNTGSDSNNGTSTGTAWQTLTKVSATTFAAGDQVLFEKGGTFYGTLSMKGDGSVGNYITFGSYGTGTNPIITGFTTVTSWTNLGSNIWESTNAVSTLSTCNMVTVNGVNTAMGRYPNSGFLNYQSHSGNTSITTSSLTGSPNWSGADMVIRLKHYIIGERTITSQSGGTLNFSDLGSEPNDSYGFFIQNDARTLDVQNEWYYNPTTKKIRIYSTSQPTNVKVSSVDYLVEYAKETYNYSKCSYIKIQNLSFIGSNDNAIHGYSSLVAGHLLHHVIIQNCNISFVGFDGIHIMSANYCTFDGNTISETNGSAITANHVGITSITNNTLSNISLNKGMGSEYSDCAISTFLSKSLSIQYNSISNCGFNGISFACDSTALIKYNFIQGCNQKSDDGGAITTGNNNIYGCKIIGNVCVNGYGGYGGTPNTSGMVVGLYLDDGSANLEVSNNTVGNFDWVGLYLHNSSSNNIHDNVIYNARYAQLRMIDDTNAGYTQSNLINHNQFISKESTQKVAYFSSIYDNLTSVFGTFDYNVYSCPIDDNLTINTYTPSTGSVNRSLSGWKTYLGQDLHSSISPFSISYVNDLRFEYNETSSVKTINLDQNYRDIRTNSDHTILTLQPYTSMVLIKHTAYPSTSTRKSGVLKGKPFVVKGNIIRM